MSDKHEVSCAGIYIHVPFCKSRCIYCGFYSTVGTEWRQRYVDALCEEMRLRGVVHPLTVYLGGGTPSQLSASQLHQLFDCMEEVYGPGWQERDGVPIEVTMECNPDDVDEPFALLVSELPVNRVSLGVQTFDDARLRFLHRRHTAMQAIEAVARLRAIGIANISIDLMFGFPNQTLDEWRHDIESALTLNVEHLSAYSLMYEEGTLLYRMLTKREVTETDEELYINMYDTMVGMLRENDYHHYEISNFAREGMHSRHNSLYWNDMPYMGFGASAHSYDGKTRQWNVADVEEYIAAISQGCIPSEGEFINQQTRYNDMITTRLRTCEGIDLTWMKGVFGEDMYDYLLRNAAPMIERGLLKLDEHHLHLTLEGIYVSDMVMGEMVIIEGEG